MKQIIKLSLISILLIATVLSNKNIAAAAAPSKKLVKKPDSSDSSKSSSKSGSGSGTSSKSEQDDAELKRVLEDSVKTDMEDKKKRIDVELNAALLEKIACIEKEKEEVDGELQDKRAMLAAAGEEDMDVLTVMIEYIEQQIVRLDLDKKTCVDTLEKQLDEQAKVSSAPAGGASAASAPIGNASAGSVRAKSPVVQKPINARPDKKDFQAGKEPAKQPVSTNAPQAKPVRDDKNKGKESAAAPRGPQRQLFQLQPLEKINSERYEKLLAEYRDLQKQRDAIRHTNSTEQQIIDLTMAIDVKLEQLKNVLRLASVSPYYYSGDLGDKYSAIEDRFYEQHVAYGTIFAVPGSVKDALIHVVGAKQNESICGFLTFAHAWAIDWLIANHKPVTSDTIQVMSQKIFDAEFCSEIDTEINSKIFGKYKVVGSHAIRYLTCDDAEKIALALYTKNNDGGEFLSEKALGNIFKMVPGFYKFSSAGLTLANLFQIDANLKAVVERDIKTRRATHFMINSGKHWSLVSVINNPETHTYDIIHVNSSNNPLQETDLEMPAIREIIQLMSNLSR